MYIHDNLLVLATNTFESVVEPLAWFSDQQVHTFVDHSFLTIFPLHNLTGSFRSLDTDWDSSWFAGCFQSFDGNFGKNRLDIGDWSFVLALVNWNLSDDSVWLEFTILPDNISAVFISSPDLLSSLIDFPLGIAYGFCYIFTDGFLLDFLKGMDFILVTFLWNEGFCYCDVIVIHPSYSGDGIADSVSFSVAFSGWSGDANILAFLLAVSLDLVAADWLYSFIVGDFCVRGNVNAVIIMTIAVMIT